MHSQVSPAFSRTMLAVNRVHALPVGEPADWGRQSTSSSLTLEGAADLMLSPPSTVAVSEMDECEARRFVLQHEKRRMAELRENAELDKVRADLAFLEDSLADDSPGASSEWRPQSSTGAPGPSPAQATDSDCDKPICYSGWLTKQGGGSTVFSRKNWKHRFFQLDKDTLRYSKTKASPPLGIIPLSDILRFELVSVGDDIRDTFAVHTPKRIYFCTAACTAEAENWITILTRARAIYNRTIAVVDRPEGLLF